jgi:hypothetical protein
MEHQINFNNWLLGFTEGDGCFSINKQKNIWSLCYKVTQSTYNARIIYFIKDRLGCGSVTYEHSLNLINFRIRNLVNFKEVLFPIFDTVNFMTIKYWDYLKIKEAYSILTNDNIDILEKDILMLSLLSRKRPEDYFSPVYKDLSSTINFNSYDALTYDYVRKLFHDYWIIGFVEVEGSFFITKKSANRYVHSFGITQKHDRIMLVCLSKFFHFTNKVQLKEQGFYSLETSNSRVINNIVAFFSGRLKGRKSLEYRIWVRCLKYKHDYVLLQKYQSFLRRIRMYRPSIKLNDEGIVPTTM